MIGFVLFFGVLLSLSAQQPGAIRGVVQSTTGEPIRKAWAQVEGMDNAAVVAAIRVFRVQEGEAIHEIGYLHLPGRSVHPISCTGSE